MSGFAWLRGPSGAGSMALTQRLRAPPPLRAGFLGPGGGSVERGAGSGRGRLGVAGGTKGALVPPGEAGKSRAAAQSAAGAGRSGAPDAAGGGGTPSTYGSKSPRRYNPCWCCIECVHLRSHYGTGTGEMTGSTGERHCRRCGKSLAGRRRNAAFCGEICRVTQWQVDHPNQTRERQRQAKARQRAAARRVAAGRPPDDLRRRSVDCIDWLGNPRRGSRGGLRDW